MSSPVWRRGKMVVEHAPPLALTPGEPAGIGPDLCARLAQQVREIPLVAVCDPRLLVTRAQQLGLSLTPEAFDPQRPPTLAPGRLTVLHCGLASPCHAGAVDARNAHYVLETLRRATKGCLSGEFSALVTGPVHKGIINEAGIPFSGHTEFLAELTGGMPVMMLSCPGLRVALATTHLPLRDVSAAITRESLDAVIRTLHRDLVDRFGLAEPRILVCGLNPHAGEGGYLGSEEIETIIPLLDDLRSRGMKLRGPLPADTLFTPRYLETADAVLAMYHDQGLPVLKHLGFGKAVNITLGLPMIRTSVDHGTALDLAGKGQADIGSLLAAIHTAWGMANQKTED